MDPTSEVLTGFNTLEDLCDWANFKGPNAAAVLAALGDPVTFRDVEMIPRPVYVETVTTTKFGDNDGLLSPVQVARAMSFRLAARAKLGLPTHEDPSCAPAQAAVTTLALPGPMAPTLALQDRKVKMSTLVDTTLDACVSALDQETLEGLFARYKASRGDFPHADIEPTEDQISAVSQLLKHGAAPYVDFSIFGPHGRRLLRKLTFISYQYNAPEGSWKRLELPGPPDFDAWWKCWMVLSTTLLLLEAVKAERLALYGELIRSLVQQLSLIHI